MVRREIQKAAIVCNEVIARTDRWAPKFSYVRDYQSVVAESADALDRVVAEELDSLTDVELAEIADAARTFRDKLQEHWEAFARHDPQDLDWAAYRGEIARAYGALHVVTLPLRLPRSQPKRQPTPEQLQQAMSESEKLVKQRLDTYVAELNARRDALEQDFRRRIAAAGEAAALSGVSGNAEHFSEEAERNWRTAGVALLACRNCVGLLMLFAILCLAVHGSGVLGELSTWVTVQLIAAKAVVVSALYYLTVVFGKRHLAFEHNAVVNRHRSNAIKTYRMMVEATTNQDDRDKVLDKVCTCVFSPQPSGFSRGESPDGSPAINLINLNPSAIGPTTPKT